MKFEFIKHEEEKEPTPAPGYIKISRAEFFNDYNTDKEKFWEELSCVIKMYCCPNCFGVEISEEDIQDIAKNFKTTYKYLYFDTIYNEQHQPDLLISFLK